MKPILPFVLFAALIALAGCQSLVTRATDDAAQIQLLLQKILPADFTGDFSDTETNMYFNYTVSVGGLHKLSDGTWAFSWLSFDGQGHFPLTPALSWNGEHHIHLGAKPTP